MERGALWLLKGQSVVAVEESYGNVKIMCGFRVVNTEGRTGSRWQDLLSSMLLSLVSDPSEDWGCSESSFNF